MTDQSRAAHRAWRTRRAARLAELEDTWLKLTTDVGRGLLFDTRSNRALLIRINGANAKLRRRFGDRAPQRKTILAEAREQAEIEILARLAANPDDPAHREVVVLVRELDGLRDLLRSPEPEEAFPDAA